MEIDPRLLTACPSSVVISRLRYSEKGHCLTEDTVVIEAPLQITLHWYDDVRPCQQIFTITMRTPGYDLALVLGLLHAEGVISNCEVIARICYEDDCDVVGNQIDVYFRPDFIPDLASSQRQLMSTASCGLCGKSLLKAIELLKPLRLNDEKGWLSPKFILQLGVNLRKLQCVFAETGGIHGAAAFNSAGELLASAEDIGRHNALDKVIGELLNSQRLGGKLVVIVSSRLSYELVQKSVMAGVAVLVAVGAPSDLAIAAAKQFDLTLIGFASDKQFNVYHGDWRISQAE